MRKSVMGGMLGGGSATFVELLCARARYKVWEAKTDVGFAYVYPIAFAKDELESLRPGIVIPDALSKYIYPIGISEVKEIVGKIAQADQPRTILEKLAQHNLSIMVVTGAMLKDRKAVEVIFGSQSLRLKFIKRILDDGMPVDDATRILVEETRKMYDMPIQAAAPVPVPAPALAPAPALPVAVGSGGSAEDEYVRSPIYNLFEHEEDMMIDEVGGGGGAYADQVGGHYNSNDFISMVFFPEGKITPATIINESSLIADITYYDLQFIDPLVSSVTLFKLGFLSVADDSFVCPTIESLKAFVPGVGVINDPTNAHLALSRLVFSANRCGGAKHFKHAIKNLAVDVVGQPTWVQYQLPQAPLINSLPPQQLKGIKEALEAKVAESTAYAISALSSGSNPAFAAITPFSFTQPAAILQGATLPPLFGGGGPSGRWLYNHMADVWERLLDIRKKELAQINKRLSVKSWNNILDIIERYRSIEQQLSSIDGVLAQYRYTAEDREEEELDDLSTIKSLVNDKNELEIRRNRNIVKINDIFKALFDTLYTTPPAVPAY